LHHRVHSHLRTRKKINLAEHDAGEHRLLRTPVTRDLDADRCAAPDPQIVRPAVAAEGEMWHQRFSTAPCSRNSRNSASLSKRIVMPRSPLLIEMLNWPHARSGLVE
jgi:hypothetical protein